MMACEERSSCRGGQNLFAGNTDVTLARCRLPSVSEALRSPTVLHHIRNKTSPMLWTPCSYRVAYSISEGALALSSRYLLSSGELGVDILECCLLASATPRARRPTSERACRARCSLSQSHADESPCRQVNGGLAASLSSTGRQGGYIFGTRAFACAPSPFHLGTR